MKKNYKIADKVIEVTSIYNGVHEYCKDYLTDEYKQILQDRYERAVQEIAEGKVAPDDDNSPYKDQGMLETDWIEGFKENKVWRDQVDEEWLHNMLEMAK